MKKGIYVIATGTDVGKTYLCALLTKKLQELGINVGYYKPALSGSKSLATSDAGFVKNFANLNQDLSSMISYLFTNAYSPHLASKIEKSIVSLSKIKNDYEYVQSNFDFVVVEGSGGIICPLCWENESKLLLEDVVKFLNLEVVLVTDSGLGTINSTVLTVEYLKSKQIKVRGIIANNYQSSILCDDNLKMIEELTTIPILAKIKKGDIDLNIENDTIFKIFDINKNEFCR